MVAVVIISSKYFRSRGGKLLQNVKPLAQGHTASKNLNVKDSGLEGSQGLGKFQGKNRGSGHCEEVWERGRSCLEYARLWKKQWEEGVWVS